MQVVIAGTGHRPPRLGLDYDADSNRLLTDFARTALEKVLSDGYVVEEVVSGFAQGWDQALAHAAISLGLPLVAALPFDGQESRWPTQAKERFASLLSRAKHVEVVSVHANKDAYLKRDEWMVDRAAASGHGMLLCLFDSAPYGGTHYTVEYAKSKGLSINNLWNAWQKIVDAELV